MKSLLYSNIIPLAVLIVVFGVSIYFFYRSINNINKKIQFIDDGIKSLTNRLNDYEQKCRLSNELKDVMTNKEKNEVHNVDLYDDNTNVDENNADEDNTNEDNTNEDNTNEDNTNEDNTNEDNTNEDDADEELPENLSDDDILSNLNEIKSNLEDNVSELSDDVPENNQELKPQPSKTTNPRAPAKNYDVGHVITEDNKTWVVEQTRNGIKRWRRKI